MVLVDTSIWVFHFRQGSHRLETLLEASDVMVHPFVIGELACGHFKNRSEILSLLQALPAAPVLGHDEFLQFIERRSLAGLGIGFVDVHLLASARLAGMPLWTLDKKLNFIAGDMKLSYDLEV